MRLPGSAKNDDEAIEYAQKHRALAHGMKETIPEMREKIKAKKIWSVKVPIT